MRVHYATYLKTFIIHIYFKNSMYYLLEFYLVLVYLIQMKWGYFYICLREILCSITIHINTQARGDISHFLSILMNFVLKSYRLYFRFCYNCSCIFRKGIINQQAFLWDCVAQEDLVCLIVLLAALTITILGKALSIISRRDGNEIR